MPSGDHLADADWKSFESQRFRFRLMLPDADHWIEQSDERWLKLVHTASESSLELRTWVASPRVTRHQCLEQLYLWQGDLRPMGDAMLTQPLMAPAGYDVELRIDLQTQSGADSVAVAYGAQVRRCSAAVFRTHETKHDSEGGLGERLRLMVEGTLAKVEIIGIDARAIRGSPAGSGVGQAF